MWILIAWSVLALGWWIVAYRLTRSAMRHSSAPAGADADDTRRLSIFKPMARLRDAEEAELLATAVESFASQLDEHAELLLGLHEQDRTTWEPYLRGWRSRCARTSLRVVFRDGPDRHPNPKVSWQRILARHARGELWLWSDADMIAPPGFLVTIRSELRRGTPIERRLLTSAYVIRDVPRATGLLEALFTNVEFFPGVSLLGRLDVIRFGFGSAMLFRARDFHDRASWDEIGNELAEDHVLGLRLQRVRLSSVVLSTFAHSTRWRGALLHYLRWQKTIRWCRPCGFAGQLLILPLLGWAAAIALAPADTLRWSGFAAMWLVEVAVACAICRSVGCRIGTRRLGVVAGWSMLRAVSWLACWLPWPVRWRDRLWWAPRASTSLTSSRPPLVEPNLLARRATVAPAVERQEQPSASLGSA